MSTVLASRVLGRAAGRLSDGACLLAVLAAPLYFSVLTPAGYEADKAALIRVLAVLAGGAWLTERALSSKSVNLDRGGRILVLLGATLVACFALSTLLSIDPSLSLWGSFTRQEGLVTRAGYLVIGLVVAFRFRTERQVDRLLLTLAIGSLPVTLYGITQQAGWDPVPNSGDPTTLGWPVRSSLGQHIFLGSYLVMVIPLTAGQLLRAWLTRDQSRTDSGMWREAAIVSSLAVIAVSFFLFLDLMVLVPALSAVFPLVLAAFAVIALTLLRVCGGRLQADTAVPLYGLLLALQVVTLLLTGARGAWLAFLASVPVFGILVAWRLGRPRVAATLVGVTLLAGLALLLLNIPGGPLQPLRDRPGINRLANITESGGAQGSAQGRLFIWQGVGTLLTETPSIGDTWGGPGRDVVGYGPETLHWAFERVYPLELRRVTSEIWTWDRAHDIFLDYLVDTGVLGLLAFVALLAAFFWRCVRSLRASSPAAAAVIAGMAASMVGHLTDGIFGLETPTSLLLLWLLVGLCVGLMWGAEREEEPDEPVPAVLGAQAPAAVALVVAVLAAGFLVRPVQHPAIVAAVWLLAVVLGAGWVAWSEGPTEDSAAATPFGSRRRVLSIAAIVLVSALALGAQIRFETAAIASRAGNDALNSGEYARAIGLLQTAGVSDQAEPQYPTNLGGAYLAVGVTHTDSTDPSFRPSSADVLTVNPDTALTLGQIQLYQLSEYSLKRAQDLAPLDPDVYDNLGNFYLQANEPDQALAAFQRAEQLSPNNPRYLDQEALAQLQGGRNSAALKMARQAVALDPTFWYSHYALAKSFHRLVDTPQAKVEAAQALYWMRNYWPPPNQAYVSELQNIQRQG